MTDDPGALTAPFRELFELCPDAILVFLAGDITHANPAAVHLLRAPSMRSLIGRASRDIIAPESLPLVAERAQRLMSGAVKATRAEEKYVRLDGTIVDVEAHASRASFYDGKAFIVLLRDITDRKAAEQLEHRLASQKMDGIGKLAGGVAHEFNNLLTVILESADHLAQVPDPDGDLDRIREATRRAATLTQQLLAVAHQAPAKPRVAPIDELVRQSARALPQVLGEPITLVTDLRATGFLASVDPGQLDLAVMNVAINAREAMPRGGTLSVSTRVLDAPVDPGGAPSPCVALEIRDTGKGMDQATRRRAFEPFFSTKPAAAGTGLGLSTTYGIVAQLGGRIELESEVGRGTCVRILIPQCSALSADEAEPLPPSSHPDRSTILLLEDEPAVRRATSRMLRSLGYVVLDAGLPSEALALAKAHPGPIDALVTDVVMPELTGPEAAAAFRAIRPDAAVLFVSGYSHEALPQTSAAHGIRPLCKPFTKAELASALQEAIEARRS